MNTLSELLFTEPSLLREGFFLRGVNYESNS